MDTVESINWKLDSAITVDKTSIIVNGFDKMKYGACFVDWMWMWRTDNSLLSKSFLNFLWLEGDPRRGWQILKQCFLLDNEVSVETLTTSLAIRITALILSKQPHIQANILIWIFTCDLKI